MSTLIIQQDTVDVSQYHEPVAAFAGYVAGNWPTFDPSAAKYPHALRKAIAIHADENGDILDCESGDASVSEYVGWHQRMKARGVELPGPYAARDDMETIIQLAANAGISTSEMAIWTANPDGQANLQNVPNGTKAKQYDWHGFGLNLDLSACSPSFWAGTVPHHNTVPYERFSRAQRPFVRAYDKYRAQQTPTHHPHQRKLAVIRKTLAAQAALCFRLAHTFKKPNGRPGWNRFHRGWRYQNLIHRAHGQRFV